MRKKTDIQYVCEVKEIHGTSLWPIEKYVNCKTKIKHECYKGHTWKAYPSNVLCGNGCLRCSQVTTKMQQLGGKGKTPNEVYLNQVLDLHGKIIWPVEDYKTAHTKIKHKCCKGHVFLIEPHEVKKGRGCPTCSVHPNNRQYHVDMYPDRVREVHGKNLWPLENFQGDGTPILHECTEGHKWKVFPAYIKAGSGCPICRPKSTYRYKLKVVHRRNYALQGFEPQVLHHLVYGEKWKQPCKNEDRPIIRYKFPEEKRRKYHPDFYWPQYNLIGEVKGIYTMGLCGPIHGKTNALGELKAKRRDTIRAGYKFQLFLWDENEGLLELPKEWWKMTKRQLRTYFGL
jgi:hypothetical protein